MTDNTNPKLLVSKADAIVAIHKQIQIGKELLETQIHSEKDFTNLKHKTRNWTDDNKSRFKSLFDKSPLSRSHGLIFAAIVGRSLHDEIADHKEYIYEWINDLESIHNQLEIYQELPSSPQQTMNKDTTNNENKKIFIGHGHSLVWRELKDFIVETLGLEYEEFNRISSAGTATSDRLKEMLEVSCMAFLIMTGEDEQVDGSLRARNNVIHEVGLFQGKLGFERAIILLEEDCEDFSNIHGITYIRFPKGNIRAAFEDIRDVLKRESISEQERRQDINHSTPTPNKYEVKTLITLPIQTIISENTGVNSKNTVIIMVCPLSM